MLRARCYRYGTCAVLLPRLILPHYTLLPPRTLPGHVVLKLRVTRCVCCTFTNTRVPGNGYSAHTASRAFYRALRLHAALIIVRCAFLRSAYATRRTFAPLPTATPRGILLFPPSSTAGGRTLLPLHAFTDSRNPHAPALELYLPATALLPFPLTYYLLTGRSITASISTSSTT